VVNVASDPNLPTLTVIGSSYLQITASTPLNVLSAVTLSSCATALSTSKVVYRWSIKNSKNPSFTIGLVSTSRQDSKYALPAYSLQVGETYTLTITASLGTSSTSASPITIFISQGLVTAAVVGGYVRSTPIDLPFNLDASISTDADVSPALLTASTLIYTWTCTIGSRELFGQECGIFNTGVTALSTALITLKANSMKLDISYVLRIVVSSKDGRSAAQTVTLSAVDTGSAQVEITSTFVKFNPGSTLSIFSNLVATYAVDAEWSVRNSSGLLVPFVALTSQKKIISKVDTVKPGISFPLLISANTFTAGSVFSFRLTVQ
jgi:hypothetical protein